MAGLAHGLYDALLDEELRTILERHPELRSVFGKIDMEEEPSRYATFVARVVESVLRLGMSPVTDSGVTITNAESRLFVCNSSTGNYQIPGTGQYIWNFDSSYPIGIFLPNGMNAFGADFSGGIIPQNNPFNATITVNLTGGQTYAYNFTGQLGSWTFRGFVFPDTISSLAYSDGGPFLPGAHEELLDNVTFGIGVPEPRTLWFFACAAIFSLISRSRISRIQVQLFCTHKVSLNSFRRRYQVISMPTGQWSLPCTLARMKARLRRGRRAAEIRK